MRYEDCTFQTRITELVNCIIENQVHELPKDDCTGCDVSRSLLQLPKPRFNFLCLVKTPQTRQFLIERVKRNLLSTQVNSISTQLMTHYTSRLLRSKWWSKTTKHLLSSIRLVRSSLSKQAALAVNENNCRNFSRRRNKAIQRRHLHKTHSSLSVLEVLCKYSPLHCQRFSFPLPTQHHPCQAKETHSTDR